MPLIHPQTIKEEEGEPGVLTEEMKEANDRSEEEEQQEDEDWDEVCVFNFFISHYVSAMWNGNNNA